MGSSSPGIEGERTAAPDFELTAEEKALLAAIKFDALTLRDHVDAARNGDAVCALTKSLLGRKAVPAIRRSWFVDPELNVGGRGVSRKQVFERNGTGGDEIFRHPHFLPYLWYFLFGARLPAGAIAEFQAAVAGCGQVTSSDVVPLGKKARAIARAYGLTEYGTADEFHKLALECGLWHGHAAHIRDGVKRMRLR